MSARSRKSCASMLLAPSLRFSKRHLEQHPRRLRPATPGSWTNCACAQRSMSTVTFVAGRKLPRSMRTHFLYSASEGCTTRPSAPNIAASVRPELHELEAHEPVVDAGEGRPAELDHVDLAARGRHVVEERRDQRRGSCVLEERAVDQVDADDAERLLLLLGLAVREPDVNGDVRRRSQRLGLKADAEPAVAVFLARVAARGHRVGEDEELGLVAALAVETLDQQVVLVIEHRLQPLPADVAIALAVDGVAEGHVVRRHRLGDRARGAADAEEPARHLLAGANLGERAVPDGVEVDLEGLEVRVGRVLCHDCLYVPDRSCNRQSVQRPESTGWCRGKEGLDVRARTLALARGDVTRYTGAASRYGSFEPRLARRRAARPGRAPQLPRSPDAGVDEVLGDARHPGHRARGELGRDPGAVQMGLRLPQSRRRLPRRSLQPAARDRREPVRVVGRHVDDRSRRRRTTSSSRRARSWGSARRSTSPPRWRSITDFHRGPTRSRAVGFHQMGIYVGRDRRRASAATWRIIRVSAGDGRSKRAASSASRTRCPCSVLAGTRSHRRPGQTLASTSPARSASASCLEQRLVHPAGALLHAARAGRLGRAGLDAGDPEGGVRHRAGQGGRVGDALLADRGHRRRDCRRLAGRSLDAAQPARPNLYVSAIGMIAASSRRCSASATRPRPACCGWRSPS